MRNEYQFHLMTMLLFLPQAFSNHQIKFNSQAYTNDIIYFSISSLVCYLNHHDCSLYAYINDTNDFKIDRYLSSNRSIFEIIDVAMSSKQNLLRPIFNTAFMINVFKPVRRRVVSAMKLLTCRKCF